MYDVEYSEQFCSTPGCGKKLTTDEIALYLKMVNRGAKSGFLCISCLAKYFDTTEDAMRERIEHFRQQGCKLFQ